LVLNFGDETKLYVVLSVFSSKIKFVDIDDDNTVAC